MTFLLFKQNLKMSFQQFYATSSEADCKNTCKSNSCQGYRWDSTGNCYLYFLVGAGNNATILENRSGKIPDINGYKASQTQCIASPCNVLKTTVLYDFNACVQLCNNDSNCSGFGADDLQYCTLIMDKGVQQQFTGYTFNKEEQAAAPTVSTLPIIIGVVVGIVVFIGILIAIMIVRLRKPIKTNLTERDSDYFEPRRFSQNRQSMSENDEVPQPPHNMYNEYNHLPVPPQNAVPLNKKQSQFKVTNATYNDMWNSRNYEKEDILIPGLDTSTHIDYHLSRNASNQ
jgi:hypothetical protein